MSRADRPWADAVIAACSPVMASAAVGFTFNDVSLDSEGGIAALLWEADPLTFAARYPDSGIEESYGAGWPAPCLDYWVYVEPDEGRCRLSVEGFNEGDVMVPLTGDGRVDGAAVAAEFARILRV